MHRSGTSATAGLLVNLGLSGPNADDLVPGNSFNERGLWESRQVIACNTKLLRQRRAYTFVPPPPQSTWNDVANYAVLRSIVAKWYTESFSGTPIVMKGPWLCLTLPLSRDARSVPLGRHSRPPRSAPGRPNVKDNNATEEFTSQSHRSSWRSTAEGV
jgi:hypothetical protein